VNGEVNNNRKLKQRIRLIRFGILHQFLCQRFLIGQTVAYPCANTATIQCKYFISNRSDVVVLFHDLNSAYNFSINRSANDCRPRCHCRRPSRPFSSAPLYTNCHLESFRVSVLQGSGTYYAYLPY
jgi:hypothetical protein